MNDSREQHQQTGKGEQRQPAKRRLGSEWKEWDGKPIPGNGFDEGPGTYLSLLIALTVFAFILLAAPGALIPNLTLRVGWFLLCASGAALLTYSLARSCNGESGGLLSYWLHSQIASWSIGPVLWLGRVLGVSKDRVGSSFVKVNNAWLQSKQTPRPDGKVIVLIPRCLAHSVRQRVEEIGVGHRCRVLSAGTGKFARYLVEREKPSGIVAVACERDLLTGLRDVAARVPVFGITMRLPEGPCINADIQLPSVETGIRFFLGLEK